MRKKSLFLSGALLSFAAYETVINWSVKTKPIVNKRNDIAYSNVPTLLVHGSLGGAQSTNSLVKQLQTRQVAEKVLVADVMPDGHVFFRGHWSEQAVNPLIQVIFRNNLEVNFGTGAYYLVNVLRALKQRFGIHAYQIIGHSWGGGSIVALALSYPKATDLPQLKKLVALAPAINNAMGPYDGFTANHRPEKMDQAYQKLVAQKQHFPAVKVLNIYGDLDQRNTDGSVPVPAAQALHYLVMNRATSYIEKRLTGHATHRALRTNEKVVDWIVDFLWAAK